MEVRKPRDHVCIEGETNKPMTIVVRPSYSDDPLVVGPRYQNEDFRFTSANWMSKESCGVFVCGLNSLAKSSKYLIAAKPTKFYRLKGLLGQATDNYFTTGRIVEKSRFHFIKRHNIDRICASMQSSYQKKMFEYVLFLHVWIYFSFKKIQVL